MSVIYATLERLEAEDASPACDSERPGLQPPVSRSGRLSMQMLGLAVIVLLTGVSLNLWQRIDGTLAAPSHEPDGAVGHRVMQESPVPEVISATVAHQSTARPGPAEPDVNPALEEDAVVVQPAPTDAIAVRGERRIAVKGFTIEKEYPEPERMGNTPGAVEETADSVSASVRVVENGRAHSGEWQQASAGENNQSDMVEQVIEKARLALSRGEYQRALSVLGGLVPVPENRAEFWLIKGSAHLGIGQLDQAAESFAAAQALTPDNAQIAVQRAILMQERGDHAGALQVLKGAAVRHPDMPEIYLNQGYSEYALGALRDAERSFRIFLSMTESRSLYVQQRAAVKEWLAQGSSLQG